MRAYPNVRNLLGPKSYIEYPYSHTLVRSDLKRRSKKANRIQIRELLKINLF